MAQLVQPMLAKHHIQQVRQSQNSHHTAPCEFFLFPALRTPWQVKLLKTRKIKGTATQQLVQMYRADWTTGGASSSGRASEISLSKQKGSGSEGIST
jgi:hypothetical protein